MTLGAHRVTSFGSGDLASRLKAARGGFHDPLTRKSNYWRFSCTASIRAMAESLPAGTLVLDLGCGNGVYGTLFHAQRSHAADAGSLLPELMRRWFKRMQTRWGGQTATRLLQPLWKETYYRWLLPWLHRLHSGDDRDDFALGYIGVFEKTGPPPGPGSETVGGEIAPTPSGERGSLP